MNPNATFPTPAAEVRPANPSPVQLALPEIENLALSHADKLKGLEATIRETSEKLEEELSEIKEYREAEEALKKAKEAKDAAKGKALEVQKIAELNAKIGDLREEKKDLKEGLSVYLDQYVTASGKVVLRDKDGNEFKIKKSLTLKNGGKKNIRA